MGRGANLSCPAEGRDPQLVPPSLSADLREPCAAPAPSRSRGEGRSQSRGAWEERPRAIGQRLLGASWRERPGPAPDES